MAELLEVEYYHFALDPVTTAVTEDNITMSVKAANRALEKAGVRRGCGTHVYGSAHQDQMPTASVRIQEGLGIERCAELSIHANCTSAYKSLLVASDMIRNGRYNNALVISSSMSSSELIAEYYNQPLVTKKSCSCATSFPTELPPCSFRLLPEMKAGSISTTFIWSRPVEENFGHG